MQGSVWQSSPHLLSRRLGVRISAGRAAPLFSRGMKRRKSRVPDTFQLDAIFPFSAFLASTKISNLPYVISIPPRDPSCNFLYGREVRCFAATPNQESAYRKKGSSQSAQDERLRRWLGLFQP